MNPKMKASLEDIKVSTTRAMAHVFDSHVPEGRAMTVSLNADTCAILRTLLAIIETVIKLEGNP